MKSIFTSKTFWLNVLAGAVMLSSDTTVAQALHLTPAAMGMIFAVLNIINRFFTTQPVTVK